MDYQGFNVGEELSEKRGVYCIRDNERTYVVGRCKQEAFRVLFDLEGARWRIDRSVFELATLLEFVIARDSYFLTS